MPILDDILNLIRTLRDKIVGEVSERIADVADRVNIIPDAIDGLIDSFVEGVERLQGNILDKLSEWTERISNTFVSVVEKISGVFADAVRQLVDKLRDFASGISEGLADVIEEMRESAERTRERISQGLGDIVSGVASIGQAIGDKMRELGERLVSGMREAYEVVQAKISQVIASILTAIREVLEHLRDKLEALYNSVTEYVNQNILMPIHKWSGEAGEFASFKANVLLRAALGEYNSIDQLMEDLRDPLPVAGGAAALIGGIVLTMILSPVVSTVLSPAFENIYHLAAEKFRPQLLTPDQTITALFRGVITPERARVELSRFGLADERQNILIQAARPLPSPAAVQEAFLRGFISEGEHDSYLRRHGYADRDIALQKSLYWIIPGPADLIRMAVREAFTPDVAQQFGQYEDFPAAFAEWAERQGLSREWAERYWAAHWDLPSPSMGFEMLHRGIITTDELKLLLKALDVMPFWRDKLIQLSFVPYTRVDLRRMYSMGILTEADVFRSYKDLGYDDEKARNLTEFTTRYYAPEEETTLDTYRELTRTVYITAYKKGVITRDEAQNYLLGIGYHQADADLLLDIADAELMLQYQKADTIPLRDQTRKMVLDVYQRGLLSEAEAREMLSDLGYSTDEIDWYVALTEYEYTVSLKMLVLESIHKRYIERTITKSQAAAELGQLFPQNREQETLFDAWDIERDARVRKPTEAQFRAALTRGIITIEDYAEELRGLGYAEKYVKMLVKLVGG